MFSWLVGNEGQGSHFVELFGNWGGPRSRTDEKVKEICQCLRSPPPQYSLRSFKRSTYSPLRFLWWASLLYGAQAQQTKPFPAQFELSSLDGTNGFILNGEAAYDNSGSTVSSAGDMNGDGVADLVIGAYRADRPGRKSAGKSYVVFGNPILSSIVATGGLFELSSLNGLNGFIINGEGTDDNSGYFVSSAGDMNGDGLADLVIGARHASPSGRNRAGKSYVVFGSRTLVSGGTFELSSLNGRNGFILNGEAADDRSGWTVSSAGDMNGDGISDLVISARDASPSGRTQAGKTYVVFGSRTVVSGGILELSSLNGTNGFILNGEEANDRSGSTVSSAGDVNGDGISDIVIGAYYATPSGKSKAGKSYVVFGSRKIVSGGIMELSFINGSNGFILNGESANDNSGRSVSSAGDMNGDGLADFVISGDSADPSGRNDAGKSYVVFGSRTLVSGGILELSSLNGQNGIILNGEFSGDQSSRSVSSAGDVNGDGLADLLIGARNADPSGKTSAGKSYLVFGSRQLLSGGNLELSSLNGMNGVIFKGEAAGDHCGISVSSAGDLNGDGISDLVIGAYYASPSGRTEAGRSYVVFGPRLSQSTLPPSLTMETISSQTILTASNLTTSLTPGITLPSFQLTSKPTALPATSLSDNVITFAIPDKSPTQKFGSPTQSSTVFSTFSTASQIRKVTSNITKSFSSPQQVDQALVIGLSVGGGILALGFSLLCGCLWIAKKKNSEQESDHELNQVETTAQTDTENPNGNYDKITLMPAYDIGIISVGED